MFFFFFSLNFSPWLFWPKLVTKFDLNSQVIWVHEHGFLPFSSKLIFHPLGKQVKNTYPSSVPWIQHLSSPLSFISVAGYWYMAQAPLCTWSHYINTTWHFSARPIHIAWCQSLETNQRCSILTSRYSWCLVALLQRFQWSCAELYLILPPLFLLQKTVDQGGSLESCI